MLNKVRLSNMQELFSFSELLQFSRCLSLHDRSLAKGTHREPCGCTRSFQRDRRETYIRHILISSPSFLSDLLIPLIPRPLISRSRRRSRSRNNNARRNRPRGGSIEESRKRECNVIRTVHCRMMGLYIDIGGWVREGGARGWSTGERAATRQAGRRVRRRHPPIVRLPARPPLATALHNKAAG